MRVTVTRVVGGRGLQRRPDVNTQGAALVKRWNRRRSLAPREDGEFTLLDDLRRQVRGVSALLDCRCSILAQTQ
eukprot:COSAG02_NODE_2144_length_9681_cov_209.373304_10_plen_74_part_00